MATDLNLLRESLNLLILRSLAREPRHGYAIAEWIERSTLAQFRVEEGTLYPALYRLAAHGWVESAWGRSTNGRRARFHALTDAGREHLATQSVVWERFVQAIAGALRSPD